MINMSPFVSISHKNPFLPFFACFWVAKWLHTLFPVLYVHIWMCIGFWGSIMYSKLTVKQTPCLLSFFSLKWRGKLGQLGQRSTCFWYRLLLVELMYIDASCYQMSLTTLGQILNSGLFEHPFLLLHKKNVPLVIHTICEASNRSCLVA